MHTMKKIVGTVLAALFALGLTVPAFAQNSAWDYSVKKDISGKVTEIAMRDQSEGIGTDDSLIIRCKATCEVYIHIGRSIAEDQSSIRVKFIDKAPARLGVSRGEGSDSLFFTNPMSIIKAIRDNGGYMTVEYSPYQRTPVMVKFGVWNLPPSILERLTRFEAHRPQVVHNLTLDEMAEQAGRSSFITNPPGAEVFIDGNKVGVTPLALNLKKQGKPRVVTIKLAGYKTVENEYDPDGAIIVDLTLEKEQ
jgi:hypothetical protein